MNGGLGLVTPTWFRARSTACAPVRILELQLTADADPEFLLRTLPMTDVCSAGLSLRSRCATTLGQCLRLCPQATSPSQHDATVPSSSSPPAPTSTSALSCEEGIIVLQDLLPQASELTPTSASGLGGVAATSPSATSSVDRLQRPGGSPTKSPVLSNPRWPRPADFALPRHRLLSKSWALRVMSLLLSRTSVQPTRYLLRLDWTWRSEPVATVVQVDHLYNRSTLS